MNKPACNFIWKILSCSYAFWFRIQSTLTPSWLSCDNLVISGTSIHIRHICLEWLDFSYVFRCSNFVLVVLFPLNPRFFPSNTFDWIGSCSFLLFYSFSLCFSLINYPHSYFTLFQFSLNICKENLVYHHLLRGISHGNIQQRGESVCLTVGITICGSVSFSLSFWPQFLQWWTRLPRDWSRGGQPNTFLSDLQ